MMLIRAAVLVVVAFALTSCNRGGDTPTAPSRPTNPSSPFVGIWSGPIVDDSVGSGSLRVTVAEQVDRSLFGSWSATFADPTLNDSGTLTAFLNGSSSAIFITLSTSRSCPVPIVTGTITANLTVNSTQMSGIFAALGCMAVRGGTIDLVKQ
jgi:hypothetical protein